MDDPGVSCCSCPLQLLFSAPCSFSPDIQPRHLLPLSKRLEHMAHPNMGVIALQAACPKKSKRESTEQPAQLCNTAVCRKGISEDAVLRNK